MERITNVVKWGNSGGILLPREWLGKQVKIVLIDRTEDIKKEVMNILQPYLDEIIGIYLVGSYARNEQEESSDIDIIVLSASLKESIHSGRYEIDIYPLENVKETLKKNPIMILPRLIEAKAIMNKLLLQELLSLKVSKESFYEYIDECKRIVKINEGLIRMDQGEERVAGSAAIAYSLLLRLRGLYLIKCILENVRYKKKEFMKWLAMETGLNEKEIEEVHAIYTLTKIYRKVKQQLKMEVIKKLIHLIDKELMKYGKKSKKT